MHFPLPHNQFVEEAASREGEAVYGRVAIEFRANLEDLVIGVHVTDMEVVRLDANDGAVLVVPFGEVV
jgi:hypothetical protein